MDTSEPPISKKEAAFLEAIAQGFSVTKACIISGLPRRTAYNHRKNVPVFAELWDDAIEAGTDRVEDEALRRAVEGTHDPVFYQGEQVGTITRYSDGLLVTLLKARRPEKYKDRQVHEHAGAVNIEGLRDSLESKFDRLAAGGEPG